MKKSLTSLFPPCGRLLAPLLAVLALSGAARAATQTSYWTFDEASSPYVNSNDAADPLVQDTNTSIAGTGVGLVGNAAHIQFSGTTTTRLDANGTDQGSDSFGFSIFIKAQFLNAFDSFMQKETPFGGGNGFDDFAWQLHLVGNNGNGAAPIEFVLRGQNSGFGAVTSTETLGLSGSGNTGDWFHIAGGYDASTGAISLFVRDMSTESVANQYTATGSTGMITNGAGSFSVGSGLDETTNSGYAAAGGNFFADELRIYSAPLSASEVASIETAAIPEPQTYAMIALGTGLLVLCKFRRQVSLG